MRNNKYTWIWFQFSILADLYDAVVAASVCSLVTPTKAIANGRYTASVTGTTKETYVNVSSAFLQPDCSVSLRVNIFLLIFSYKSARNIYFRCTIVIGDSFR